MKSRFVSFVCVVAFLIAPVSTQAQTESFSQILTRMSAILNEMEALKNEFAVLQRQAAGALVGGGVAAAPATSNSSLGAVFTHSLQNGETNNDILRIQRLLKTDSEIYPEGVVSGFYGPKTEAAIKNLQERFGYKRVGVIGPATTALLESFFTAYPNENWPAGVLTSRPVVAVAPITTVVPTVAGATISAPVSTVASGLESIEAYMDRGEAKVEVEYTNGSDTDFYVSGDSRSEIIVAITRRLSTNETAVRAVIEFFSAGSSSSDDADEDHDEDDAEDAIDDADDAIKDADDEIDEADEDGDEVGRSKQLLEEAEDLLDEAEDAFDDEDYDEAVEKAEEAEELAEDAEDEIGEEVSNEKGDSDDIDEIKARVKGDDDTEVTVEYDNGDEYEFDVEEDKQDEIIEEVVDELNIDEDEVEDVIEFDFGDIDTITAYEEDDRWRVEVEFDSGVGLRIKLDVDLSKNDVIEAVADELDEDEEDIEDLIDFD